MKPALLVLALLLLPGASALTFTETFEGFDLTASPPEFIPDADWYDYAGTTDLGEVTTGGNVLNGVQWFHADSEDRTSSSSSFNLANPAQLTNLTFTINATTPSENTVGSRQVIAIQSAAPVRTMVEFFVFCSDQSNPENCEFRVRFENVDTTGQVLINSTVGDRVFNVSVLPDWNDGTFDLFVNGVDDGTFTFLELPENVGRVQFRQYASAWPMKFSVDDLAVAGALPTPVDQPADIATGLKNWATDIRFTNPASLFLLGIVVFAVLVAAVLVPLITLGNDNSTFSSSAFFGSLAAVWLVFLEWWPEWVGVSLIIVVAALIALVMRRMVMGIRDASTNAGIVAGSLGYFIIATSLLGFSGYATEEIQIPSSSLETPDDVEAQVNESISQQSFVGGVTECLITFFSDCDRSTVSTTWAAITDVAGTIFNFARTAFTFLFQLLTFSLPIGPIFNAMIVLPPAAALATVGFSFVTRSGS